MKVRLKINYNDGEATAFIDMDLNVFTHEMAKDNLDFFGWNYGNDPRYESAKRHGIESIIEATHSNYNLIGVIERFSINSAKEGFFPLDGKFGLTLIAVDKYEFIEEEFEMKII
jgi:hypothetical protein